MLNVLVSVTFRVKVATELGEVVGVVGSCRELGTWRPERAQILNLVPESGNRDVWSRVIALPPTVELQYRYFTGFVRESDHEGEERSVTVNTWETNILPRTFHILDYTKNTDATQEAVYGHYNGRERISRGWLTGQTEVRLYLCDNPILLWKMRHQDHLIRVKCTTMDLRYKDMVDEESNECGIPTANHTSCVQVAVLNSTDVIASSQSRWGTVYKPNDYLIFKVQTCDLEFLGYQLDLFIGRHGESESESHHLGTAYLLPNSLSDMSGRKMLPINSVKNKPIGQLTVGYQVIRPLVGYSCDMAVSYAHTWKRGRRPLDVGHRGMGVSYASKQSAPTRENTIASLSEAVAHGADFVEFDVQLSVDKIPIVYHDFNICLSIKKKDRDEQEWFRMAVHKLNLEQLQLLKLENESEMDKTKEASSFDGAPHNHQPFPTLKQCFDEVDPHIGFNIEIKYPMRMKSGEMEDGMVHFMDRNQYIDHILACVLRDAGKRRVVMSCFDPDICTMIRLKQNKYPVTLLCQDDNNVYAPYMDVRSQKLNFSLHYAKFEQMLGVSSFTLSLLDKPAFITMAKDLDLVIFCWGEMNNDRQTIHKLKQLGIDAIIYDRISEFKMDKENVFKMEHKAKLELMSQVTAIDTPWNGIKRKTTSESSFLVAMAQ